MKLPSTQVEIFHRPIPFEDFDLFLSTTAVVFGMLKVRALCVIDYDRENLFSW